MGRPQEALTYFDAGIRVLGARPVDPDPQDDAIRYLHRAMARFNLGDLDGAAADLETAVRLDPKEHYHVLWLHQVRVRLHQDDALELAANSEKLDRTMWPWPLIALHLGQADVEGVRKAALASQDPAKRTDQACDAGLALGIHHIERGDPNKARRLLKSAV